MRDARASASTSAAVIRITADDVAHYAYAREGNAHVVFRYTGPRPELRGALLRLLKTPAGARGDRAWRCHTVDALVWGADRDEASWTTLDAAARDAFFANAPTTSGRAGWRDDRAVVRVDGDALNALALKTSARASRARAARASGRAVGRTDAVLARARGATLGDVRREQIDAALRLLIDEQCKLPFVARYRKERTDGLDEGQLRAVAAAHAEWTRLESKRESAFEAPISAVRVAMNFPATVYGTISP